MPSFAERYMQGILGGLDIKRTQQIMKTRDLENLYTEEKIAGIREARKRERELDLWFRKQFPGAEGALGLMEKGFPAAKSLEMIDYKTPGEKRETEEKELAEKKAGLPWQLLPGYIGAKGKGEFVEDVQKRGLGLSTLEEMGVVPKREKVEATTPRALTDNEKLAHYRIKIEKGTATEAEKNFVEQKGYDRETGKKVEKEGDEFAFRKTAQWKDIYGLVKQEIMREKRKPLSVEDIAEAEKQADKYYRDLLETSGSSEYSKYFID